MVGLALALATASWWFVERPFRTRRLFSTRPALFRACAAAGVAVAVGGGAVALAKGLPQRLSPRIDALAAGADDHNPYRDRCFALTAEDLHAGRFCRIGVDGQPTLMVWGDSHADAVMAAFDAEAKAHGIAGIDVTHGSCPPLLGVEVHEREDNLCPPLSAAALDVIERYDIRKVVLAGRWGGYAEGALYVAGAPPVLLRETGSSAAPPKTWRDNHVVFARALERTFARLTGEGRQVYVLAPIPEVDRPVPETLAKAAMLRRPVDFAPTRQAYEARQGFTRATLHRMALRYGVVEIDPAASLCGPQRCRLTLDGRSLYYDADHLSVRGAMFLEPLLTPVFTDTRRAPQIAAAPAGSAPSAHLGANLIAPSSRIAAALR